jgi:hypothetical protein
MPNCISRLGTLRASAIFHALICARFKGHRPALQGACSKNQPSLMRNRSPAWDPWLCFRARGKKIKCVRHAILVGALLLATGGRNSEIRNCLKILSSSDMLVVVSGRTQYCHLGLRNMVLRPGVSLSISNRRHEQKNLNHTWTNMAHRFDENM